MAATVVRPVADYPRVAIDRTQARSMTISTSGIVASEHPLASQAGASVLAAGGSAIDAAIATNAVMGAVAPMMNGVGGDLFAIVFDAPSSQIHGLNASGWTPASMTRDRLIRHGVREMPQTGIGSVTTPGAVAGWLALHERFGRLALAHVLGPAIAVAHAGFPVSELTAKEWHGSEAHLRSSAGATRTFLPDGRAPRAGEVFRNPDLGWTYEQIASGGAGAFYEGEIARRILACAADQGGDWSAADLAEFEAEWVDPLCTTYRGWQVFELPPNGQGIAALMMLNILEAFDLASAGHNCAEALHTIIEAKKLAYADMRRHTCDPRFNPAPSAAMLSKSYARARAAAIDPRVANPRVDAAIGTPAAADTTYLSVVDRDGSMVSLIQSNFANFGSGLVAGGTGFALQNRGGLFTLDAAHPNALEPRKRPLHTIIPGLMTRGDQRIAFGIMGGWNQAQAHAQFVSNIVDHGMNIQEALEAARVAKLSFDGVDVIVESRVPAETRAQLAARGHELIVQGAFSSLVGGGQSVMRDVRGVNYGASDPRKDGAAVPEPFLV